jgi:hypothetical protein
VIGWWFAHAAELQKRNRASEGMKADFYTEEDARRASVYTREDMTLLVGLLDALNRQASKIYQVLLGILAIGIFIAIRILFR